MTDVIVEKEVTVEVSDAVYSGALPALHRYGLVDCSKFVTVLPLK